MAKASMPSLARQSQAQRDYEAEDDHRTLTRAEEVRADPSRMKRVSAFHRDKMRSMAKIGSALKRRAPSRGRR